MKLFYEEPEISIRKYDFPSNALFTESVTEPPDLATAMISATSSAKITYSPLRRGEFLFYVFVQFVGA